jgi:hypothetical protein
MMTGIGVTLLITGVLAYSVTDNFKPDCAVWKRLVINCIIAVGVLLTIVGHLL